jgi:hypothetical protein
MRKRGWKDDSSEGLLADKRATGLAKRSDILTGFDLFDANERDPTPTSQRKHLRSGKKVRSVGFERLPRSRISMDTTVTSG